MLMDAFRRREAGFFAGSMKSWIEKFEVTVRGVVQEASSKCQVRRTRIELDVVDRPIKDHWQ